MLRCKAGASHHKRNQAHMADAILVKALAPAQELSAPGYRLEFNCISQQTVSTPQLALAQHFRVTQHC